MATFSPVVFVFNNTGSAISAFAPNGLTAGSIANWMESPQFTPSQLRVSQVSDPDLAPGHILDGTNQILFQLHSGEVYHLTINFPGGVDANLLLYLSLNQWTLYDALEGQVLDTGVVEKGPAFGLTL